MNLKGQDPSRRRICDTDASHKRSVTSCSCCSVTLGVPRKLIWNLHVGEVLVVVPIIMRTIRGVVVVGLILRLASNALRTQGF